jgi:hypothetical protein
MIPGPGLAYGLYVLRRTASSEIVLKEFLVFKRG